MGLIESVVFRRDDACVVVECRHCGTTVERGTTACPVCENGEIVTYRIR